MVDGLSDEELVWVGRFIGHADVVSASVRSAEESLQGAKPDDPEWRREVLDAVAPWYALAVVVDGLKPPLALAELHLRLTAWLDALCELGGEIREELLDGVEGGIERGLRSLPAARGSGSAFEQEVWRRAGGVSGVG